jgi:hypothetical protein
MALSLSSCVGKLFTACINMRLTLYLDSTGVLGDEQASFREGCSTVDHICVLHSLVNLYIAKGKRVYCAFVDYKKAFDLVDRSSLWSKLIGNHINGNIITVIYNMYKNAKSCVKKGNTLSELFTCNIGVRQGENLSPLLFAIFLNDFEMFVSKSYSGLTMFNEEANTHLSDDDVEYFLRMYVLLYADDTIVMAESAEELQAALNSVYEYCNLWHLTVNTDKTRVVIFAKGKVRRYPDFMFGVDVLKVVDDYVYLGAMFNYNGKLDKAMNKQISQARRAMFALLTKARRLSLPIDIQCELFDKMILPILLYGCEVWGSANLTHIEIFYRKFLKMLLKLHKSTPNCIVYGELGKRSLESVVSKRMISYWIKVTEGRSSKLSCIVYKLLRELYEANEYKSDWIVKVKSILDNCGLSNVWLNQDSNVSKTCVKGLVNRQLDDMSLQVWSAQLSTHEFCRTYKLIKSECKLESYLLQLRFKERTDLTKLRCGFHKLPVHLNRFTGVVTEMLCPLCNHAEISDEFHYLFKCSALSQHRVLYLKKILFC